MSHIALLYGSVRPSRLGVRAVTWISTMLRERGYEVSIVDQMEEQLPILEAPLHHYQDPSQAPESVRRVAKTLTAADGFVVVAGEYNHAIQPGLANMIDYFYRGQFGWKPALIASYSYGPFGGVRAAAQLRAHLAEVGLVTVPTTIAIGAIHEKLDKDGVPQSEPMVGYANAALDELGFYVRALAAERAKGLPGA